MSKLSGKCVLLSASPYSFKGEKGDTIEGTSVLMYPMENLRPVYEDRQHGIQPIKASLPSKMAGKVKSAPAVYDYTYVVRTGADLKPQLKVEDLVYIGEVLPYLLETMPEAEISPAFTSEVMAKVKRIIDTKAQGNKV
jgi:hypothetical protein